MIDLFVEELYSFRPKEAVFMESGLVVTNHTHLLQPRLPSVLLLVIKITTCDQVSSPVSVHL